MKRRNRIDNIDEKIDVLPKINKVQLATSRSISCNVTPEEKINILKFFYDIYDKERHNIGTKYKEELHEIIGDILNDRIPLETLSLGDVKNVLFSNFPNLDRNR